MLTAPMIPDPLRDIPAGGRQLVANAKRILRTRGWPGLTVEAVTKASGLDKSAIRYYFGNKDGLVVTLVESIIHSENVDELRRLERLSSVDDRLGVHLAQHQASVTSPDATTFLELVPVMLRHEKLRQRFAGWYDWYRQADAWAIAPSASGEQKERTLVLASLLQAASDGLSVQCAADRTIDLDAIFAQWRRMIRRTLDPEQLVGASASAHAGRSGTASTESGSETAARRPAADLPLVPDPLKDTPPSGRRLVSEAKTLLVDRGWTGLTVGAVTAAARLDKSLVSYYFGNKAGLVVALVESIIHDENAEELQHLSHLSTAENALELHLLQHRTSAGSYPSVVVFFELVPNLARDRVLRQRLATWNTWYRDVDAWVLGLETDRPAKEYGHLATLMEAVSDGLSLQLAANPAFGIDATYSLWGDMLRQELLCASEAEQVRLAAQTP